MSEADAPPKAAAATGPARRTLGDAALAISFLTLLPLPERAFAGGSMRRAAGWFPLVGVAIGAFAGGVRAAAESLVGAGPATVLALIALVAATGALHQDGLADCADGLGVRGDRERRLAVMRDSAIGTFGMLALLGWGLLAFTTLAPLTNADVLTALIAAASLGRAAALAHATVTPPARRDGLGAGFTVPTAALAAGIATAAVATALVTRDLADTLLALAAAALATAAVTAWSRRTLGGRTGDTLGATVALTEVAVLLALAAAWT
ncbi:adenosylcobinamide-GDP ribazoletransferase [Conexibacter stalactiti]|uniref:Adenosylcobinamide-GDP ribazoletransferase n=1 Tax=Conexibacter stalactiti TaxID=1940611 RepID=A0ABU4I0U9_9ACTN|nr:adenosylcobinamide-GDP ribazoletransferase [Conexibacter stalactiti]MDW5598370.1 adenosylcobinamide-GDP ribazoletransferase [Conexibacter stalactiti]MEC5039012.1 adenosylcobinamide-GDP ribazoletransferase [Conexibacter stalactiti]